jgi:outer membrane protein TolC
MANAASEPPATVPPTLTLADAIMLALRYNPDIRSAEMQRVIDKFNLRLAKNGYELQYALTAGAHYNNSVSSDQRSESDSYTLFQPAVSIKQSRFGTTGSVAMSNPLSHQASTGVRPYNPSVTFNITQPLLKGFSPAVNMLPLYDAYDTEILNKLTLKTNLISSITNIITAYTALIAAQNSLKTLQITIAGQLADFKRQQALVKTGRNAPSDLVSYQSNIAGNQVLMQNAVISVDQARAALLNDLGLDPNSVLNLPEKAVMEDKIPTLAESLRIGLENNTSYQSAIIKLKQAKNAVITAQDKQRWQLDLTGARVQGGGSGRDRPDNANLPSLTNGQNASTTVGLALTIPIHDLSAQKELVSAKIGLEQAQMALLKAKYDAENSIKSSFNTLLTQKEQLTTSQQAVQLSAQTLAIAQAKLKFGRATPFEVTSNQTALTSQQIGFISAQSNYINTLAAFDKAVGTTLNRWHIKVRY